MPKELEEALARSYTKRKRKGKLKGVDKGAYVYGTMTRLQKEGKIAPWRELK